MVIPKSEGFDALFRQEPFAPLVALNVSRQAMLKTVVFTRQLCVRAVKI